MDILSDVRILFGLKANLLNNVMVTALFTPFGALSFKVMYDSTQDFINVGKSGSNILKKYSLKKTDLSKKILKLLICSIATLATLLGYSIAYISVNSSLDLNAEHGWDNWWNVWPTVFGGLIFNGFGFLNIVTTCAKTVLTYISFNAKQRLILKRHEKAISFFNQYNCVIDKLNKINLQGFSSTG